jgi:hypothetical protein
VTEDVGVGEVIPIRSDRTEPLRFVIGRDKFGRGIVSEMHGLYGGIFTIRDAALRFAKFGLGGRPGTVSIAKAPLELFAEYRRVG